MSHQAPNHWTDLQRSFYEWLEKQAFQDVSQESEAELMWWLAVGYGRGREDCPPHEIILKSLPRDGREAPLRQALALRIARILERHPDLQSPDSISEEAFTQLMLVAQHLGMSETLAAPLWKTFETVKAQAVPISLSLSSSFLWALIYNPLIKTCDGDSSKEPSLPERTWLAILNGTPDPVVGGIPENAINGCFMLHCRQGRPLLDAVGRAMIPFAKHCDKVDRRNRLYCVRAALERFKNLWQITNPMAFIQMADEAAWHSNGIEWALVTLPTLFVNFGLCATQKINYGNSHLYHCVVWHKSLDVLRAVTSDLKTMHSYCGGAYCMVEIPHQYEESVTQFLTDFEHWWVSQCNLEVGEGELLEALRSRSQTWQEGFKKSTDTSHFAKMYSVKRQNMSFQLV